MSQQEKGQAEDKQRSMGMGKVNPGSSLFCEFWGSLLGWEKGVWPVSVTYCDKKETPKFSGLKQ